MTNLHNHSIVLINNIFLAEKRGKRLQDFDNRQLNIIIRNNLRLLGIKSCNKSTKILAKTIFYVKSRNIVLDAYKANEIYCSISKLYNNTTPKNIKDNIDYALSHRDVLKSKQNFKRVFNFEYSEDVFTNKNFIEEFVNTLN